MFARHGKISRLGESHIVIKNDSYHESFSKLFQLEIEDEDEFPPRGWFNLKPCKVKGIEREGFWQISNWRMVKMIKSQEGRS